MAEQRARAEIPRAFPELPVRDVAFLGAGLDSDAYLVNDEWVFRFPKREAVARALNREVALLSKLAGRLPVATPRFAHIGHQTGSGLLFAGYRLIRGSRSPRSSMVPSPTPTRSGFLPRSRRACGASTAFRSLMHWGDLATGDPDYDLLYLRQDYGEHFVRRLLGHYPHPEPVRLFRKLRVFDACDHVTTIVASRRDLAEHDAIHEAMTALGELLEQE